MTGKWLIPVILMDVNWF